MTQILVTCLACLPTKPGHFIGKLFGVEDCIGHGVLINYCSGMAYNHQPGNAQGIGLHLRSERELIGWDRMGAYFLFYR